MTILDSTVGRDEQRHWDDVVEEYAARRPGLWREYCDRLHRDLLARWLANVTAIRALKTDLFDEAVGDGLVEVLSSVAAEVHGCDVAPRAVAAARVRHPDLVAKVGDVRDLDYPSAHFDVIVSNSTLDHFERRADIDVALAELHRVLRPGGVLIVSFDNRANPVVALRSALPAEPLHRLGLVPFTIGATLTPAELAAALTDAGFAVERERTVMHAPRIVVVRLLQALDGLLAPGRGRWLVAALLRLERLARGPAPAATGYFAAAVARRPYGS